MIDKIGICYDFVVGANCVGEGHEVTAMDTINSHGVSQVAPEMNYIIVELRVVIPREVHQLVLVVIHGHPQIGHVEVRISWRVVDEAFHDSFGFQSVRVHAHSS